MASLAEKLGRRFEARALKTIAAATQSDRRDQAVPSNPSDPSAHPHRGTLADLLAEDLAATDRATAR